MKGRIWIKVYRKNKIINDYIYTANRDNVDKVLQQVCYEMDISKPIWNNSLMQQWNNYGIVYFRKDDFIDAVGFDKLELIYCAE